MELRSKPRLQINLDQDRIEVTDVLDPKNSGSYPLRQIKEVEMNEERTNWFISIVSHIADLLTGSAVGGMFKDKAILKLILEDRIVKIRLTDADSEKAKTVAESINKKIIAGHHPELKQG